MATEVNKSQLKCFLGSSVRIRYDLSVRREARYKSYKTVLKPFYITRSAVFQPSNCRTIVYGRLTIGCHRVELINETVNEGN